MILGPGFHRFTPSTKVINDILTNNLPIIPPLTFNPIDVRDIAKAQIIVYEDNNAEGRYITATRPYTMREIIDLVAKYGPHVKKPRLKMGKGLFIFYARLSSFFARLFGKAPLVTTQQAKEYTEGDGWPRD